MIGALPVVTVDTDLVIKVLSPIWSRKTETTTRRRRRIESILDWATVSKFRQGENPARWRGLLENLLANPHGARWHHGTWFPFHIPRLVFRSQGQQFFTWVCEHALAHRLPDKVEAAYRCGDLLDKRIIRMQAWSDDCPPKTN